MPSILGIIDKEVKRDKNSYLCRAYIQREKTIKIQMNKIHSMSIGAKKIK